MFNAEADFPRAGLMMLSSADGGDDEESDAVKITMTVLTKFDNGRIYVESKTDSDLEALFPSANTKCYFTNDGNGNIQSYVWQNDQWVLGNTVGVSSVDDMNPFKNQYLDHSYFSKTDFGCALEKKNFSLQNSLHFL